MMIPLRVHKLAVGLFHVRPDKEIQSMKSAQVLRSRASVKYITLSNVQASNVHVRAGSPSRQCHQRP
jgi:hypothetical protein